MSRHVFGRTSDQNRIEPQTRIINLRTTLHVYIHTLSLSLSRSHHTHTNTHARTRTRTTHRVWTRELAVYGCMNTWIVYACRDTWTHRHTYVETHELTGILTSVHYYVCIQIHCGTHDWAVWLVCVPSILERMCTDVHKHGHTEMHVYAFKYTLAQYTFTHCCVCFALRT